MADDADVWRAGLQARGRSWVLAELQMRAGQPQDPLYDVVHAPPYPSREFCQRWCVEDANKFMRVSGSTKAALCAFVILCVCLAMAVHSFTGTETSSATGALARRVSTQ
jgi:hypothetical protein